MTRLLLSTLLAATILALPACSHPQHASVSEVATTVTDPTFEGNWKTTNTVFSIKRASGDHYTVKPQDSNSSYDATLLDIGNIRFVQFTIHEPQNSSEVPVYMFGRLTIKGNDLTFRRIRAEWLEHASKGAAGLTYKSTADVQSNSGGVIATDPTTLHDLLAKAATDPAAFGETETAHRVK